MSTDLTLSMAPDAIQARMNYAKALAQSGMIPAHFQRNPANVLVAIETGTALHIPAIQALTGIAVINGRATITADLMSAAVRKAGHRLRVEEKNGSVTASLIRADDPDFTYTATWDQAKAERAGLWGKKGPWSQYPGQMLRARAITEVCRQGASDALFGMIYSPEEMGATVDKDGRVIEAEPGEEPMDAPAPITVDQQANIADLVRQIGVTDEQLAYAVGWASMPQGRVSTVEDMTEAEADKLIDFMLSKVHEGQEQAVLDVEVVADEEADE